MLAVSWGVGGKFCHIIAPAPAPFHTAAEVQIWRVILVNIVYNFLRHTKNICEGCPAFGFLALVPDGIFLRCGKRANDPADTTDWGPLHRGS